MNVCGTRAPTTPVCICLQMWKWSPVGVNSTLSSGACGSGTYSMKFNYPTLPDSGRICGRVTCTHSINQKAGKTCKCRFCSCYGASCMCARVCNNRLCLPFGSSSTWMTFPITDVSWSDCTATLAAFTDSKTTLAMPVCFLFLGLYSISTSSISPNFLHMSVRNPSLMLSLSRANVTSLGGTGPM